MEDQENNQEQEEQGLGNQIAEAGKQQIEQAAKDTAKKAAKQAGKAIGKLALKAFAAITPYIIPVIIGIIIVVILAGGIYTIIDKIREIGDKVSSSIATFIVAGDNGPIAPSPGEMVDLVNKQLEEAGIDKEGLYLGNSIQSDMYLYKFMSTSLSTQLPYIKGSLAPSITDIALKVTNPGLSTSWEIIKDTFGEEVQGIVKIKRQTGDNTKELTYKKYEDFLELIDENKKSALEYFSIDNDWMLCIAKIDKTTTTNPDGTSQEEIELIEEKIPYQTLISAYSVPFEFFITLQQISQNAEYVSAVADLIKEGEIELTIFDSHQVITTENIYQYKTRKRWVEEQIVQKQSYTNTISSRSFVRTTSSTKDDTIKGTSLASTGQTFMGNSFQDIRNRIINYLRGQGCTSNINVVLNGSSNVIWQKNDTKYSAIIRTQELSQNQWKGQVTITDTKVQKPTTPEETTPETPEEPETEIIRVQKDETGEIQTETTVTVHEINSITASVTKANVWIINQEKNFQKNNSIDYPLREEGITIQLEPEKSDEEISKISEGSWIVDRTETTKQKVEKEEWQVITSKTDIQEGEFLKLWRKDLFGNYSPDGKLVKYKRADRFFDSFESPVGNFLSSEELLYDQLERSENTQVHAQLMRYLIQYYKDPDKAVKPDLNIFNTSEFNPIGTIQGSSIQEKVWNTLIQAGFNEYAVAGAMGNIHYESKGFNPYAIETGYTENTGGIGICQWTNSDRGDTGRNTNLKTYALSRGKTWQDEDIQVQFLLAELTGTGDATEYASYQLMTTTNDRYGRIWYHDEWENANDIENATKAFCYTFERPGTSAAISSMTERIELAQRYYNTYHGKTGDYSGNVVRYYQNDYANVAYGSSTLAKCGCGPTAFAMVASHLTGRTITPEDAVSWCRNAYYVKNQGTSWSYFSAATKYFKLPVAVKQTSSMTDVLKALNNGKLVISSQGKGLFTSEGHYILLTKIENGLIYVNDPNKNNAINKGYNTRGFSSSEITQSAKQYWIFE